MSDDNLRELHRRLYALDVERDDIARKIQALHDEEARKRFNCWCVRLNSDIGIHDMGAQEKANRNGLQLGLVSKTRSADRSCGVCDGKGIIPPRAQRAGEDERA